MINYWFEFDRNYPSTYSYLLHFGIGVTALSKEHAMYIMRKVVFENDEIPRITKCIEGIRYTDLEQNHLAPNLGGPMGLIGVWYPCGFWFRKIC